MFILINSFKRFKEIGLKHLISHTLPWRFNSLMNTIIFKSIMKVSARKKLKNIIIIESHNDFDSNGGAFYEYLLKNEYNENYKIIWFLRNGSPKKLPKNVKGFNYYKPSIRKAYYYCYAKYIICGHLMLPSIRKDQISYYTTHGGFCLKSFKGNIVVPNDISYILTPSTSLQPILANEYGIAFPNDKMISIGYPVHDILYTKEPGDLHKLTNNKYKKVVLWMPTFRRSIEGREDSNALQPLGIPIIDSIDKYEDLNEVLRLNDMLLIIKIHPMQDMKDVKISSTSNIQVLDGVSIKKLRIDNYKLMKDTDALISDYSSTAYDYLHLNRPIGFTMDDAKNYKVGFIVDNPYKYISGDIIYNYNEFIEFINKISNNIDDHLETRKELLNLIWGFKDGKSCERLVKHMGLHKNER